MSFNHSAMPSKLPNDAAMPELRGSSKPLYRTNSLLRNCKILSLHISRTISQRTLYALSPQFTGAEIHRTLPRTTRTCTSSFQHALSSPAVSAKRRIANTTSASISSTGASKWANVQNEAYARCGLDIRVSHESLEVQGINRVPTIHLSRIDWRKEQRGERTPAGDRKRAIERENKMRELCQKPHLPYYDLDYTR